jgi:hypothetical protein
LALELDERERPALWMFSECRSGVDSAIVRALCERRSFTRLSVNLRGQDDGVVLLDRERLALASRIETLRASWLDASIIVAQTFSARCLITNDVFSIAMAHWPSLLSTEATNKHSACAVELQRFVCGRTEPRGQLLVFGDLNVEPHADALERSALCTRDPIRVESKKDVLYNLAWRWCGRWDVTSPIAGSYFYEKERSLSRWRTFDHVMVSRELLPHESRRWAIDEARCGPLVLPRMHTASGRLKEIDHLPIRCTLSARAIVSKGAA